MPKHMKFISFCISIFILTLTYSLCFAPSTHSATQPQGMDVYGDTYVPPTAPANPTGATNTQGFQTFQVTPPASSTPQAPPSFVQPGTGPLATPAPTSAAPAKPATATTPAPSSPKANTPQAPQKPAPQAAPTPPAAAQPQANSPAFTPKPAPSVLTPQAPTPPPAPQKLSKAEMDDMYRQGTQDFSQGQYQKALDTLQKLAANEHAPSMVALGLLQTTGHDGAKIPVNHREALTWFRKAADLGDKDGMYRLGLMLAHGRGDAQGKKRPDTAATWFRKAADLGQHDAQFALGVLYESGEGVVASTDQAVTWYSLAAAGQNIPALARLGHFYHKGNGVAKNIGRATFLLYGATMGGNTAAQKELFDMAVEHFGEDKLPKVTLFGVDFAAEKGITRATMRSALSVSKVSPTRENTDFICDTYDLNKTVPGAKEMTICYGDTGPQKNLATQELGFLQINYPIKSEKDAERIQKMVSQRFGPPTVGEPKQGTLWNLGNVIVATKYIPDNKTVALMFMIPRVYHMTHKQ